MTLPPGCAKLTFDPNDRATWENKRVVFDAMNEPARIIEIGAEWVWASWSNGIGGKVVKAFDQATGKDVEVRTFRLYDAAPEPVKPREFFFVRRIETGEICSNLMVDKAVADSRLRTDFMNPSNYEVVRLIEAPEDQT